MEHLLQRGMSVNNFGKSPATRAEGTPLFDAAIMSMGTEVRWFLKHGADPRIKDGLGQIAIQYAIHSREVRVLMREQSKKLDSLEAGGKV